MTDSLERGDGLRGRRLLGWGVTWVVAAVLAVTVGVVAVTTVGASIRGRGPLGAGNEAVISAERNEGSMTPAPGAKAVSDSFDDEFGTFVVECRGSVAYGVDARPDKAAGWRTVSFETGPDDDVDAVFAKRNRSIDLEVFCNRGVPTLAEIEYNELPDDS